MARCLAPLRQHHRCQLDGECVARLLRNNKESFHRFNQSGSSLCVFFRLTLHVFSGVKYAVLHDADCFNAVIVIQQIRHSKVCHKRVAHDKGC